MSFAQDLDIRLGAMREGDFVTVQAVVDLPVDPRLAWDVLTDYEHYPGFISGMTRSHVATRTPQGVVLEQKGELSYLFFHQPVEMRLLVAEFPPTTVVARSVEGSASGGVRDLLGRYELQPLAGGVRFTYTGRFVPDASLLPVIGVWLVRNALARNFRELALEIRRRAAGKTAPSVQ